MFLVMDFFRFILSGVCSSSSWICDVYVSYQNWEVFSHYSSSIFFSLLFIHSFQDPSEMSGRPLCSPAGPWGFLIFFFSLFSLCCYWIDFLVQSSGSTHSFVSPFHSAAESFSWVYFGYCILQNFSLVLLYIFNSLLRWTLFSFVSNVFVIAPWSIFMVAALMSFADNFNIFVILMLSSIDCLHWLHLKLLGYGYDE